tara:strand:+ start:957 stop:1766 length:810 start_codon:yes stop_codon:yes gene_type:complete
MKIFIYQHLGMGDMISNNGLIRHLIETNQNSIYFYIFCKHKYSEALKFMYRDLKKVKIISITNNSKLEKKEVTKYLENQKKNFELIKIGHDFYKITDKLNPYYKIYPWHCSVNFYKQFGLSFNERFNKSYWQRNKDKEKKLYKNLVGKNKEYVFVHDDPNRNLIIDTSKFKKKYKIIKNDINNMIFDYGLILENAKELHLLESSFRQLIETLNIKTKKLYLYKDDRRDYSMSLYNKKTKQWVSTSKKWKEIKLKPKNKIINIFSDLIKN